jgi:hypothetical protein
MVRKYIKAIFSKLDLSEEPPVHRRVAPVLAFLRESHRFGARERGMAYWHHLAPKF